MPSPTNTRSSCSWYSSFCVGRISNSMTPARTEFRAGVIEFEILPTQKEEYQEQEDRVFVGEGIHDEVVEVDEGPVGKGAVVAEDAAEGEVEEETEDEGARDDEDEPGDSGEEKDE